MKSHTIRCPKCFNLMRFDTQWMPPQGFDPALRRFLCDSDFGCGKSIYKVVTPELFHQEKLQLSFDTG